MERTGSPAVPFIHPDKLESALYRPRNLAHYGGTDLITQAVALAVGISQAQAFEDGNKRAAYAAADTFLRLNGVVFVGDPIAFAYRLTLVAEPPEGMSRDEVIRHLDRWLRGQVETRP